MHEREHSGREMKEEVREGERDDRGREEERDKEI